MTNSEILEHPNAIAIIGMSGRFPGASDVGKFWENLRDGVESISVFSPAELQASGVDPAVLEDPSYVNRAGVLDGGDCFDAALFGYHPREAALMDPQQRVFLECAWTALEAAGYDPGSYQGLIGVFAGVARNTYFIENVEVYRDLMEAGAHYQAMLSAEKDYVATRASFKLNLRGPSINVQSACSTSGVAVHLASQSLLSGDCDIALAGGGRIRVPLKAGYHYVEGGIPSPDGYCRAFDEQAQGCVYGSGVAILVLKRLADAVRDGDHIHAVLRGSAINNDGSAKIGFTAPSVQGQAAVIADALAVADVEPNDISYVEAHGTGTTLGDPIEVAALAQAFRGRDPGLGPIRIGSVKTNIGHLDAGAAAAGLIKTALSLEHGQIPPSLHYRRPNPQIDFARSPVAVNAELCDWPAGRGPRRAGVSAFGLGGTNFHGVVEQAPSRAPSGPSRSRQLILLSARTPTALEAMTADLRRHVEQYPGINLADLAYTLQVGRQRLGWRRALLVGDCEDALCKLDGADRPDVLTQECEAFGRQVVFMFTGQGAQHANMGRGLYRNERVFSEAIDRCATLLERHIGFDLRSLVFPDEGREDWANEQLKQTAITQPALFTIEFALASLWRSWGIEPAAMIGHSLGEYVAACLAGVFTLEDALGLVAARGRLMGSMPGGSMLAVSLPEERLSPLLVPELSLAAVNAVNSSVISGPHDAVAGLETRLTAEGVACQRLRTSHAFHSAMMEPILGAFRDEVRKANPQPPLLPFVSNVTGTWIGPAEATDPDYWARQLRSAVRFADGLQTLFENPENVLLEVGPGRTLTTLARQHPGKGPGRIIVQSMRHPSEDTADFDHMLLALGRLWLGGASIDWSGYYAGEDRRRMPLPTYPFERTRHWLVPQARTTQRTVEIVDGNLPEREEPSVSPIPGVLDRKGRLVVELQSLLAGLSGLQASDISPDATFLELGFESLILTQVCATVRKRFSVEVTLGQLMDQFATATALATHLDSAIPAEESSAAETDAPRDMALAHQDLESGTSVMNTLAEVPATDGQQEIWLAAQMGEEGSCAFNLSNTLRLRGILQPSVLGDAIQALVDRHDSLRATVDPAGASIRVAPERKIDLTRIDLSALSGRERDMQLETLRKTDVATPFDLSNGPLIRATLIKLAEKDHLLFLSVHHIVADGWSCGVLVRELGEVYTALAGGKTPALPAADQFRDYAQWYRRVHDSEDAVRAEAYWMSRFQESVPVLDLPTDRLRPQVRTYNAAREDWRLDRALTEELRSAAVTQGTTLFNLTLAAFESLLHRLSGQRDIVIGVSAAGQANVGARDLVGHCVNFLPLRLTLGPENNRLSDRLRIIRDTVSEGFKHQICSYGSLLQKLKVRRDPSRIPLVSTIFNLGVVPPEAGFAGLDVEVGSNPRRYENFEIYANLVETRESLEMQWTYNTDLFDRHTIQRWLSHYETVLRAIVADPTTDVDRLPILTAEERRQLVEDWNRTAFDYARDIGVHGLFEAQADRTPEAVAVVSGLQQLTYRELDCRANQLSRHLQSLGVGSGVLVGLALNRSVDMMIGLLAVLKAGGAYLPLDPDFPSDRLQFMLEDARVALLVTESSLADQLPYAKARVCLDSDWPDIARKWRPDRLGGPANGDDLAYVIYTSGSTGKPKGVQVHHGAVVNFLLSMAQEPGLSSDDVLVAVTTLSFDIAVLELFLPMTVGARVVIADRQVAADGPALLKLLRSSQATVLQATPATWRLLLEAGWKGGEGLKALVGGEALPQDVVEGLMGRVGEVWNMYGPTETTVWSSCWRVENPGQGILIGRPIGNTQIYILDCYLQPVPVGVVGELYIAGDGVTKGYLNRPELTTERFLPDSFRGNDTARIYRTGDLARYRSDGQIECLGRVDNQVKVRGFRIELGEIEAVLAAHPAVRQVAVAVWEERAGDQRLAAYFVPDPDEDITASDLRRHVRSRLPDYMVPQHFVEIEELPLTPNGKVDRRALPLPFVAEAGANTQGQPPTTGSEILVATVWEELLGVDGISVHDNFFDLGGHSLLSLRAIARIESETGRRIPARSMVLQTLGQIAAEIDGQAA